MEEESAVIFPNKSSFYDRIISAGMDKLRDFLNS